MLKTRLARRTCKCLAALAILAALGVAALLGALSLERRSDVTLPAPTGPFAVGRKTCVWADDMHPDALAPIPGTTRELFVWIWYPSDAEQSDVAPDDYLPAAWRAALELRRGTLINLLTHDLSLVHGHSRRNSDLSAREPSYPVVIMRGGASAEVANYSTLAEDLASHGYVVVGFDAPYRTGLVVFPDGRVIARTPENNPEHFSGSELERVGGKLLTAWTADCGFVLDQLERLNASDESGKFEGRLDMTRVGIFGHSLGGATAAQFCHDDPRCKVGIDVDGNPLGSVVEEGISKPFMFVLSDHGDCSDKESRSVMAKIQAIYDRLPSDARSRIAIRGANHFTFSDDGAVLKSQFARGALRVFGRLGVDGRRQLAVTAHCVHCFFDAYLKGAGDSQVEITSPLYPEIQVLD